MPITIILAPLTLSWAHWHLVYLLGGPAQRDLALRVRLRRYSGS
jgi:hypothetical protein